MNVRHLVALVERTSSKSSYEIQLLDIWTGHVCYAFDEFKLSSSRYNSYGSIVNIYRPKRISTCKTTMRVIVADTNTVYRCNIKDGECELYTVYAVGQCDWHYKINQNSFSEFQQANDVKCDNQGNMYAITYNGLYQLYEMISYKNSCSLQKLIRHCGLVASMAIDEIRNRIIVGYENADRVHVFDYTFSPHT
ncbi:hypothetical protein DPMN_062117 [Dreissena polymorpha]|uniref:Uncharacterized protein n=1 Tax=Dreissena polymorpha TaxID=45954 RepID=A0A9D4HJW1_DREPO|nr:hypothetical protein DPMN_062117 [Dreissena polymorpha]